MRQGEKRHEHREEEIKRHCLQFLWLCTHNVQRDPGKTFRINVSLSRFCLYGQHTKTYFISMKQQNHTMTVFRNTSFKIMWGNTDCLRINVTGVVQGPSTQKLWSVIERTVMSWTWIRSKCTKMPIIPEFTHSFNLIQSKIPTLFFFGLGCETSWMQSKRNNKGSWIN